MREKPWKLTDDQLREWKTRVSGVPPEESPAQSSAHRSGAPPEKGPAPGPLRTLRFEFTGDGWEYFRIWIINVFLTVITLGAYSAWAKVRRMRYFYGHTSLDGATFDYLAEPRKILKGRLLAAGAFAIFICVASFYTDYLLLAGLAFVPLFPWLVNRALVFKARNTAYRNIRFNFAGDYASTFWVFVVLFALGMTGLFYPLFAHRRKRYVYTRLRYGTTPFRFEADFWSDFFGPYFGAGLLLGIALVFTNAITKSADIPLVTEGVTWLFLGVYFVYIQTTITNHSWNNTTLGVIRFRSTLDVPQLLWIYASNIVLIILTVGLYIPWAKVRVVRYRLEKFSASMVGSFDDFVADKEIGVTAAGEEMGDVFGWDLGL